MGMLRRVWSQQYTTDEHGALAWWATSDLPASADRQASPMTTPGMRSARQRLGELP
jgi:hypothetical protein